MNNNLHQQFLLDYLKNHRSNEISSTPNLSFDPDLLRELNARYLHDMNVAHTINENGFSSFLRAKHYHQHKHHLNILTPVIDKSSKANLSSTLSKKSNKWCTAHVRIAWMIYHQEHLKDKLSLSNGKKDEEHQSSLNNKLPDLISNIKSIVPFSSNHSSFLPLPAFKYRSPFDIPNNSFGGLGSLFPSIGKADMNPLNLNSSRFHRNIESFSSIKVDEINRKHLSSSLNRNSYHHLTNENSSLSLSRKSSSDNLKSSSHSVPSTFPTFDPLTLSNIERQRLSAAYASQGKNIFSTNIDPLLFRNNNSSSLFPNLDSSAMTAALIQREHFLNLLRLSQQQHEQMIEHERRGIKDSNSVQINKSLKTKFEQISPINKDKTKRIKLENSTSPASNSSTSSSIKFKHVNREKLLSSSSSSIVSTIQNPDLTSKDDSIPSISTTT